MLSAQHGLQLTLAMFCAVFCALALAATFLCIRATRRLRAVSFQLDTILRHVDEGILLFNTDGTVALMSAYSAQLLSVPEDTRSYAPVVGQFECFEPGGRIIPPEDWPSARALRGDYVKDRYILYRDKTHGIIGSRKITSAPAYAPDGTLRYVVLTYRDDTERHSVDEARARLAAIVEGCDDAIIGKDAQGIVTSWNRGAEKVFGYTSAEMIGQSIRRILPPEGIDEEDRILARILRGELVENFDAIRIHKQGRPVHVSLAVSPIHDARGTVIGASKVARDITRTRDLERRLQQSQKMEALGQLTGGIAHDFNNLLGIILGNLEFLERETAAEVATREDALLKRSNIRKRIQTACRATSHAAELTRRLLAFSAHVEFNPSPVSASQAIDNTIQMAIRILGPEIVITTALDQSLPPILVDPAALENALLNLVLNARDAMPGGGTIQLAARPVELDADLEAIEGQALEPGKYACISVFDNGAGMSRETLERAFEPFFTTKPLGQGTGLGLAMVYGFAKQSDGAVRIYSEFGVGTNVSLYLRFADSQPDSTVDVAVIEAVPTHSGCVLLVDDEVDLLEIAASYLTRLGYKTLQAKDGPSALAVFAAHPELDLVITDILMPGGISGFELVHRIRELRPSVRCMYTSGFPSGALANRPYRIKECSMLQKPYRLAELAAAVDKLMQNAPASTV